MRRQLSRILLSLPLVPGLQTCPNTGMELDTPPHRQKIIDNLSMQRTAESIAAHHRSVRSLLDAA
jgi:hypothetical protein